MKERKILIVGAGLAGVVLAHHLYEVDFDVLLIDSLKHNSSSNIAGGLYNPVTGRSFQLSWKANVLFPYLEEFYKKIETKTNTIFLHSKPIHFPFASFGDQNLIQGKSVDYQNIELNIHPPSDEHIFINPLGSFSSKYSGWLDVKTFLEASRKYFEQKQIYKQSSFDYSMLELNDQYAIYKQQKFDKIIFCEGTNINANPYFDWLPMKPNKGEILEIVCKNGVKDKILRKKVFFIPISEDIYKCGSTYNFEYNNENPSEEARKELCEHLEDLIKTPYLVSKHYVGIRPASKDRKPYLGFHPQHLSIGVFNGLGSKGVSLAPYFAKQLIEHISNHTPLDKEVDISRYFDKK